MSITELLGADFWPRAAATGYTLSSLIWFARIAWVPASFTPAGRLAVWREGVWLLLIVCWAVIGGHWIWLSIDPGLDRAGWSEGLTPWSTNAGWLLGLPAGIDLLAWRRVRQAWAQRRAEAT